MKVHPGERFSCEVALNPGMVSQFARLAGDNNPIHHDLEYALNTRYKGLIASGTQTTALLLGAAASYFSERGFTIGLEFWQQFRKPVFADDKIKLEWLVIRVMPNAKLNGLIVDLRGRIKKSDGQTAVGAKGRLLVINH